ncbi:tetratricopeptide repeat-containing S1 family peptidase [Streptomyces atratus]|uniref:tetratricopeptide repeat-containing S1 family peptidase n=1 Tax=Streptomyces atratus TaxID=1893 RepID=UPI00225BD07C|nr:tetratricopeptide repeat-containing serine protease family protein [Streptomyces atratus]MCX5339017.1 tetratricopeptide repeat-containing serine protease family protein [Streptomyces atratus]
MTGAWFDRRRLAEVWAAREVGGGASFGTGTVLVGRLVLTAWHVVADERGHAYERVLVRLLGGRLCPADVAWADPVLDAALLAVSAPGAGEPNTWQVPDGLVPARFGRLIGQDVRVACQAAGFPDSLTPTGTDREIDQVDGYINPMAGSRTDQYLITAGHRPDQGRPAPDARRAGWQGISGAAVTCGSLITGVVTEDTPGFGSHRLTAAPVHVLARQHGFRSIVERASGRRLVLEPVEMQEAFTPWYPALAPASPASLLRPEYEIVAFRPRAELGTLVEWCRSGPMLSGLLMTGPGGQGKTRLAREVASRLDAEDWAVGQLAQSEHLSAEHLRALASSARPLLLILDYAETRTAFATALVNHLAMHPSGHPVRVLMLGRTDGDWWQQLRRDVAPTAALAPHPLQLPLLEAADDALLSDARDQARRQLAAALARIPGYSAGPGPGAAQDAVPGAGHALTLHMSALAELLTGSGTAGESPEDVILSHEHSYWNRTAQHHGLGSEQQRLTALTAALLTGAATRPQAVDTLALAPGLRDTPEDTRLRLATWIHDLYPPDAPQVYWGSVHPDRLAEHHLARALTHHPELLDAVLPHITHDQALHALTVLTRALALPLPTGPLRERLQDLITAHPAALALPAITIAPQAQTPEPLLEALHPVCSSPGLMDDLRDQLYAAIPDQTQRLADHALTLADRQVGQYAEALDSRAWWRKLGQRGDTTLSQNLARALNNLSNRLAELGRWDEALAASTRAVEIRERLAAARPEVFLPDFAVSLNNLSADLAELGRREEALAASMRAVEIREELAAARPEVFLPDFAVSLNNLSADLAELGRREEALAASMRAVEIREELAAARPEVFLPGLAVSLNNQSNRLAELGRNKEALVAISRAVEIRERLATVHPDAFLPDLALSLSNCAVRQDEMGRREEALTSVTRAIAMLKNLAAARPAVFNRLLTECIAHQGALRSPGRPPRAALPQPRPRDRAAGTLHMSHRRSGTEAARPAP